MEYLKNEALSTMLPDWKGNPILGKEFQYLDRAFRPEWKVVFKMLTTANPQRKQKRADQWKVPTQSDVSYLEDKRSDWIVWLGHATFVIQIGGVRMITDPVFYDLPMIPRKVKIPFDLKLLKNIDFVLLSHDHRDHCDKKSFATLLKNNNPTILTSLKMTDVIGPWIGRTTYQEAGWYQIYDTEKFDIRITYLPAQHWCRRGLTDFNRRLWGSFMIESKGKTIYFGADSAAGSHFRQIGALFPNIDVAILGIGAYKPEFMMRDNHTSPAEAYTAFQELGAKRMLPMHYGTFDLSNEPISEPFRWIQECFESGSNEALILPAVNEVVKMDWA